MVGPPVVGGGTLNNFVLCGVAAMALCGCGTTLSATARRVQRMEQPKASGCENLGIVEGSSSLSGVSRSTGINNALHEMYESAAALGATHVSYEDKKGAYWSTGQHVQGTAYKCPTGYSGPPASVGCTKDTDCKGDRICASGTCVEPRRP